MGRTFLERYEERHGMGRTLRDRDEERRAMRGTPRPPSSRSQARGKRVPHSEAAWTEGEAIRRCAARTPGPTRLTRGWRQGQRRVAGGRFWGGDIEPPPRDPQSSTGIARGTLRAPCAAPWATAQCPAAHVRSTRPVDVQCGSRWCAHFATFLAAMRETGPMLPRSAQTRAPRATPCRSRPPSGRRRRTACISPAVAVDTELCCLLNSPSTRRGAKMSNEEKLKLRPVIEQLRAELSALNDTVVGERMRFAVDSVEVELKVGVELEAGPSGKVSFNVLGIGGEVGGSAKHSSVTTHTVKLKLLPRTGQNSQATGELLIRRDGEESET